MIKIILGIIFILISYYLVFSVGFIIGKRRNIKNESMGKIIITENDIYMSLPSDNAFNSVYMKKLDTVTFEVVYDPLKKSTV